MKRLEQRFVAMLIVCAIIGGLGILAVLHSAHLPMCWFANCWYP